MASAIALVVLLIPPLLIIFAGLVFAAMRDGGGRDGGGRLLGLTLADPLTATIKVALERSSEAEADAEA